MENNLFILIDTNNYFSRFYYGNPELTIERYLHMINDINSIFNPGFLCNIIDGERSFRYDLYSKYKSNREDKPDDYHKQFRLLKYNFKKLKYPLQTSKTLEAEDLMNLIIENLPNFKYIIVSNDKDVLQMQSENVFVIDYCNKKIDGKFVKFREKSFKDFGLDSTEEFKLYLGLKGDASDNIPGVKGIGEKNAISLAKEYKNYENLCKVIKITCISDKNLEKIRNDEENLHLSYKLISLYSTKYEFDIEKYCYRRG